MPKGTDCHISSRRQASTSRLMGKFAVLHVISRTLRPPVTESVQRSSLLCRSDFNANAHTYPFPTADITGQDWRAYRAHLIAWDHSKRRAAEKNSSQLRRPPYPPFVSENSWAHPLVEPEPGCLLLANSDNMSFLPGAVILIVHHEADGDTVGYILNESTERTLVQYQLQGAVSGFQQAFGGCYLQRGGPIHDDCLTLLHRFLGLQGSTKIAEGMFMGGLPDAIWLVQAGFARPQDFLLVIGKCKWRPGQLMEEISSNWWHVVAASPNLLLPCPTPPPGFALSTVTCDSRPSAALEHTRASGCGTSYPTPPSSPSAMQPQQPQKQSKRMAEDLLSRPLNQHRQRSCRGGAGAARGRNIGSSHGVSNNSDEKGEGDSRRSSGSQSPMYRRIARLAVRGA